MIAITANKIRSIFIIVFLCWLLFSQKGIEIDLEPTTKTINFVIISILYIAAALIFQIRESIAIDEKTLKISLHKQKISLNLTSIKTISQSDCWNIINFDTQDSNFSLRVSNFKKKKLERFFVENGLLNPSNNEINKKEI